MWPPNKTQTNNNKKKTKPSYNKSLKIIQRARVQALHTGEWVPFLDPYGLPRGEPKHTEQGVRTKCCWVRPPPPQKKYI